MGSAGLDGISSIYQGNPSIFAKGHLCSGGSSDPRQLVALCHAFVLFRDGRRMQNAFSREVAWFAHSLAFQLRANERRLILLMPSGIFPGKTTELSQRLTRDLGKNRSCSQRICSSPKAP